MFVKEGKSEREQGQKEKMQGGGGGKENSRGEEE